MNNNNNNHHNDSLLNKEKTADNDNVLSPATAPLLILSPLTTTNVTTTSISQSPENDQRQRPKSILLLFVLLLMLFALMAIILFVVFLVVSVYIGSTIGANTKSWTMNHSTNSTIDNDNRPIHNSTILIDRLLIQKDRRTTTTTTTTTATTTATTTSTTSTQQPTQAPIEITSTDAKSTLPPTTTSVEPKSSPTTTTTSIESTNHLHPDIIDIQSQVDHLPQLIIQHHDDESTHDDNLACLDGPVTTTTKKQKKCASIRPTMHQRRILDVGNNTLEQQVATYGHLSGFRPLAYRLNISIERARRVAFNGSLLIRLRAVTDSTRILLNLESSTSIDFGQIDVRHYCSDASICIASIIQDVDAQLVEIQLADAIRRGEVIEVRIAEFVGRETDGGGVHSHNANAPAWQAERSWTVGTLFQMRYARKILPCLDYPSLKAPLNLCVRHPNATVSRSNMRATSTLAFDDGRQIETCFESTPPLPTYLYTFGVYDRIATITSQQHELLPIVEVIFADNHNAHKFQWVLDESVIALAEMTRIANRTYPLSHLAFVVSPAPYYGIENMGLVTLQAQWIEYPRYEQGHTTLVHEVIHQWVGNLFTISRWDEICLQEGLTTYLEWKISELLGSVKTKAVAKFQEKRYESLMKESTVSLPIIRPFASTDEITGQCFSKPPLIFAMIAFGFGDDIIDKFVQIMCTRYTYNSANMSQWIDAMSSAANDRRAGRLLEQFVNQVGYPLLIVTNRSTHIHQKTIRGVDEIQSRPFILPLDIIDSRGRHQRKVFMMTESDHKLSDDIGNEYNYWMVIDPNIRTYARVIYDVDNYRNLLAQCAPPASCNQLSKTQLARIFQDFCWALLNQHLPTSNDWPSMIKQLSVVIDQPQSFRLEHDCSCCIRSEQEQSRACKWIWNDKCAKLSTLNQHHRLTGR